MDRQRTDKQTATPTLDRQTTNRRKQETTFFVLYGSRNVEKTWKWQVSGWIRLLYFLNLRSGSQNTYMCNILKNTEKHNFSTQQFFFVLVSQLSLSSLHLVEWFLARYPPHVALSHACCVYEFAPLILRCTWVDRTPGLPFGKAFSASYTHNA